MDYEWSTGKDVELQKAVVKIPFWYLLNMVYNTQNYWVFGLCPSSSILKTRKHNVSETPSASILRWGGRHLVLSKGPNKVGVSPSPEDENRSSSWNVVFCSF
jgi:hypothetical protein